MTDLGTEKVTHKSYNFNKTLHTTRQEERQGKEGPLVVAEWEAGVLNIVTWLSVGSGREFALTNPYAPRIWTICPLRCSKVKNSEAHIMHAERLNWLKLATYRRHTLFINCSSIVHQLFISFPHTGPTPVDPVEFVVSVGSIESSLGTQARMHCAHLCPTFVHCQMLIDSESTPLF